MTRTQQVRVELLSEEVFRPFGEILGVSERPLGFEGTGIHGWTSEFETDSGTQIMVLTSPFQGLRIRILERHFHVTQAAIPMGGPPSIVAVAPPSDPDDPDAIPDPADVRAFLIDGTCGYMFHKGAWHTNRYPIQPPAATFVLVTDPATTSELTGVLKHEWRRTQEIDYEERFGVVFAPILGEYT